MILKKFPLGFQWATQEPFLFCVHHLDRYPKGNEELGPDPAHLLGRQIGQDFEGLAGWRMYHGETVPGFPVHPHRGFETITVVRQGFVDHADSLGAAGRYGAGDVQWMTGGKGVQHSEMFPLLHRDSPNPCELFQIWLNLPRAKKLSDPDFKMFWREQIPVVELPEKKAKVTVIAGDPGGVSPPRPPSASWAADPATETQVWLIELGEEGEMEIPASQGEVNRSLYFYEGARLVIDGETLAGKTGVFLESRKAVKLRAIETPASVLLLQSKPIGEPVVQYGPFVMTSEAEIRQTMAEYQHTNFGGWPWKRDDLVHGPEPKRFAKHPDGAVERPDGMRDIP